MIIFPWWSGKLEVVLKVIWTPMRCPRVKNHVCPFIVFGSICVCCYFVFDSPGYASKFDIMYDLVFAIVKELREKWDLKRRLFLKNTMVQGLWFNLFFIETNILCSCFLFFFKFSGGTYIFGYGFAAMIWGPGCFVVRFYILVNVLLMPKILDKIDMKTYYFMASC